MKKVAKIFGYFENYSYLCTIIKRRERPPDVVGLNYYSNITKNTTR